MGSANLRSGLDASDVEHVGSIVVGGLLMVAGLRKKGSLGLVFNVAGAALIKRGAFGYRRLYNSVGLSLPETGRRRSLKSFGVESSVIVKRSAADLYQAWRKLENLPVFMDHLLTVRELDNRRSLWVAKAPVGMTVQWQAEIINDIENEVIAWQALEGSSVDNVGSVRFHDLGNGHTKLTVSMRYDPPADMLGIWLAKIFGEDPQRQIDRDLMRFKRFMELPPVGNALVAA